MEQILMSPVYDLKLNEQGTKYLQLQFLLVHINKDGTCLQVAPQVLCYGNVIILKFTYKTCFVKTR